jgi:hypothetical protein
MGQQRINVITVRVKPTADRKSYLDGPPRKLREIRTVTTGARRGHLSTRALGDKAPVQLFMCPAQPCSFPRLK